MLSLYLNRIVHPFIAASKASFSVERFLLIKILSSNEFFTITITSALAGYKFCY